MNTLSKALIVLTAAGLAAGACTKEEKKEAGQQGSPTQAAKPQETGEPKSQAKVAPPAKKASSSANTSFARGMMKSYEECRALLAADTSQGITQCAMGIVAASKSAHAEAPKAAHQPILSVVKAAEALAKVADDDIEAQRLGFGEVSKATVAMLTAAPVAAKNYHVFECPMAKGYQRWAQSSATLENPYMGTKMLSCGTEVHDHHKGMQEAGDAPGHRH